MDEQENYSYKILRNKKRIIIQTIILEGVESTLALITVSDITNLS